VQQFHKLGDTGEADSAPLMSILYSGSQWSLGELEDGMFQCSNPRAMRETGG